MQEIISSRNECSKTFDLGGRKRGLDCHIGAIHYKDNYADPKEQWKDIDLTWEGNCITKAPYELTLEGGKATVKDKKTGGVSTIELLEIGGFPLSLKTWELPKGLAKRFDTELEIVAGNSRVNFARILKSSKALVEAKYRVTGNMPLRIRASDTEGELPVEWTIKDGILTETLKPDRPIKYPVRIDPTIDTDVGASADDGYAYSTTFMGDYGQLRMGSSGSKSIRAFARFIDIIIPSDAIIGVNCYASFFVWSSTQPGIYLKVKADDLANPDAPTDATEVFAITPTTAGVDWDDQADVDDWANTPDIQSVIAELQASYDYSAGAAIQIIVDDDGSGNSEILYSWSYDYNGTAPKLHIEYSVDGNVTVTPNVIAQTLTEYASILKEVTTPTTLSLVDTQFIPVLKFGIMPTTLALSDTEYAPTIIVTGAVIVTPGVLEQILTEYAPILKLGVIPSTLSLSDTEYSPVLKFGITPSTLALITAGYIPVIIVPARHRNVADDLWDWFTDVPKEVRVTFTPIPDKVKFKERETNG